MRQATKRMLRENEKKEIADILRQFHNEDSWWQVRGAILGFLRATIRASMPDTFYIIQKIRPDRNNVNAVREAYSRKYSETDGTLRTPLTNAGFEYSVVESAFRVLMKYHHKKANELEEQHAEEPVEVPQPIQDIISKLPDSAQMVLIANIHFITKLDPFTITVAHGELKQIITASMREEKQRDDEGHWYTTKRFAYGDVVINAIPTRIIKFIPPTHTEHSPVKYQIEFETPHNEGFTIGPMTVENIVRALRAKGTQTIRLRQAEDALGAIIAGFELNGRVEVNREIETQGFYLVDGKIVTSKLELPTVQNPKEELVACLKFIDELISKYSQREIVPTLIKWGMMAPFNYVLKSKENWMPWLILYGFPDTGKTTLGRIPLCIWAVDNKMHHKGFTSIDTVARLGQEISQTTLPKLFNEVGALTDERYLFLVEMIKSAVESVIARNRFKGNDYEEIASLAPCIFTSNYAPPDEPAFLKRFIPVHITSAEIRPREETQKFTCWFQNEKSKLAMLGAFTKAFILRNPQLLLQENADWNEIAKQALTACYTGLNMEPPEWINWIIEQRQIANIQEQILARVRSFFLKEINDNFARHAHTTGRRLAGEVSQEIAGRLHFCLENNLIPYLHYSNDKKDIIITHDVMPELKRRVQIPSLAQLAQDLKFEYGTKQVGRKEDARPMTVAHGDLITFLDFLEVGDAEVSQQPSA